MSLSTGSGSGAPPVGALYGITQKAYPLCPNQQPHPASVPASFPASAATPSSMYWTSEHPPPCAPLEPNGGWAPSIAAFKNGEGTVYEGTYYHPGGGTSHSWHYSDSYIFTADGRFFLREYHPNQLGKKGLVLEGRGRIVKIDQVLIPPLDTDAGSAGEAKWTIQLKGTFEVQANGTGPNVFEGYDSHAADALSQALAASPSADQKVITKDVADFKRRFRDNDSIDEEEEEEGEERLPSLSARVSPVQLTLHDTCYTRYDSRHVSSLQKGEDFYEALEEMRERCIEAMQFDKEGEGEDEKNERQYAIDMVEGFLGVDFPSMEVGDDEEGSEEDESDEREEGESDESE